MRQAQKAALMAMFAALEESGDENEREIGAAAAREEKEGEGRLIQVDLVALAQARLKMPA
jgi:hypothetical protein